MTSSQKDEDMKAFDSQVQMHKGYCAWDARSWLAAIEYERERVKQETAIRKGVGEYSVPGPFVASPVCKVITPPTETPLTKLIKEMREDANSDMSFVVGSADIIRVLDACDDMREALEWYRDQTHCEIHDREVARQALKAWGSGRE